MTGRGERMERQLRCLAFGICRPGCAGLGVNRTSRTIEPSVGTAMGLRPVLAALVGAIAWAPASRRQLGVYKLLLLIDLLETSVDVSA